MKFNITEGKLDRWSKQEEGCYIAAGIASAPNTASKKTVKLAAVHQSLDPKTQSFDRVAVVRTSTSAS